MYTLRTLSDEGTEFNELLGSNYMVVLKEKSIDNFKYLFNEVFQLEYSEEKESDGRCYGFVVAEDDSKKIPLFRNRRSFIMNENGKTFANITY